MAGNTYIAGYLNSPTTLGSTPTMTPLGGLSANSYIAKIDATGNYVWAKAFIASAASTDIGTYTDDFIVDASGNVYMALNVNGTEDIDPGPGTYIANGAYATHILKLDASGNFVWAKDLANNTNSGVGNIKVDASGNIYVAGRFAGTSVDFDPGAGSVIYSTPGPFDADGYTLKLDALGNFVWVNIVGDNGSNSDNTDKLAFDAMGNVYVAGNFNGTVDFDNGAGTTNLTGPNTFLAKYDVAGNFVWVKQGVPLPNSMVADASGVYMAGKVNSGTVDFDPSGAVFDLTGTTEDIFVSKLDASGNFVWAQRLGGTVGGENDKGSDIVLDTNSDVYVTGFFKGTNVDFDAGAGSTLLSSVSTSNDVFVLKLNSAGNFTWVKQVGGTGNDEGIDIVIDNGDNIYYAGNFVGTVDLNPDAGVDNFIRATSTAFTTKLKTALPAITSFTPTNGIAGTSVTITGTNFNVAYNDNVVYIGGLKVNPTAGSATSLTFTVPLGASSVSPIVVQDEVTGKQASSLNATTHFFTVTTSPTLAVNANTYSTKTITVDNSPRATAVGDFNNDGKPDVAVVNGSANNVSIRLGDGTGNFSNTATLSTGTSSFPYAIKTDDLNNDGKLDLVVANFGLNNVRALLGDGTGNFPTAYNTSVGTNPTDVALADFNGDGFVDIATAHTNGDNIYVKLGDGTGNFYGSVTIGVFNDAQSLAVGDFDLDGDIDIACVGPNTTNNLLVATNTGSGTFNAPTISTVAGGVSSASVSIATGRFDADTDLDLLIGFNNGDIRLFTGSAGASFTPSTINAHTNPANNITIADCNGDGNTDYISAHGAGGDKLVMALGNGTGGFANITLPFNGAFGVSSADFNLDGKADIVACDTGTAIVKVLLYSPVPTITSFSPTNGGIGTSVTITGNNFNATPANNYVYFGAIRTIPTAGSTTSLTVTVPAGATSVTPIVVQDKFSGKQVSSMETITGAAVRQFTVTNSPALTITGMSYAKTDYTLGTTSLSGIATSDFNGDGIADLVTTKFTVSNNVYVQLGTATGTFGSATNLSAGQFASAAASADFNNDGKMDFLVANYSGSNVSMFLGNGDGTFGAATNFSIGTGTAYALAVRLLGNGTGNFATATSLTAAIGAGTTGIAVGDFNVDGNIDLVSANKDINNISLLLGVGNGTFGAATTFAVGDRPFSVVVGDFNNDGRSDVATANNSTDNVSVLLGNGAGSFSAATDFAVGSGPYYISVADFNGDNKMDLVTPNNGSTMSILLGDGTGNFATATDYALGGAGRASCIGDFNLDGKTDIAVAKATSSNNVSVFSYTPPFSATTATNVTSTSFTANWTADATATSYDIEISTSGSFTGTPTQTGITGVSSVRSGLSPNTVYYYKVRQGTPSAGAWSNTKMTSTYILAGSGSMLNFNSSGQYVNIGASPTLFSGSNAYTFETWINVSTLDARGIAQQDANNDQMQVSLDLTATGTLRFSTNKFTTTGWHTVETTSPVITANRWYHVAFVSSNASTKSIYVNGILQTTTSSGTPDNSATQSNKFWEVGKSFLGGTMGITSQNGRIDELRIWNTARAEAQIRASMCSKLTGSESGLVVYLPFDDSASGVTENKAHYAAFDNWIANAPSLQTSSAPLGDVSAYTYNITSGVTLTNTDVMRASNITGSPTAVYLYKVNATPNTVTPPSNYASLYTDRYWGMFFVGGTTPQATLAYNYSANTAVDVANALRFAQRDNNADNTWISLGGVQNRPSKRLTHTETNAGEFILAERNAVITNYKDGGTVLTFNGSSGYVDMPRYVQDNFTIEFWVRPTALGLSSSDWENGTGLVTANTAGFDKDFGIVLLDNKIGFGTPNASNTANQTLVSTSLVVLNKWTHVAVTRSSAGNLELYFNGKLEASATGSNITLNGATALHIGKRLTGGNFFNGSIDELRIWNTALSANTIKDWVNLRAQDAHPNFANLEAY
ncbi:MAG: hypothetical protein EAZ95_02970, partial [Bacteroidetes bacterium]